MRILSVPDWFEFPPYTPISRRFEMLGQSVDGRVLAAIANNLATAFLKVKNMFKQTVNHDTSRSVNVIEEAILFDEHGQMELAF